MPAKAIVRLTFSVCLSIPACSLLAGCSASLQPEALSDSVDAQTPMGEITGEVHGGQYPITGAQIYLFAAGTTGYASAATSLITSGKTGVTCNTSGTLKADCYVTTNSSGDFALAGDYGCTAGTQVYMVAVGGNPQVGGTGTINNTAITQMAGLGECPAGGNLAAQVPYVVINEVTTVAFAYAMGGFGTDAFHVGSSGTALAQAGIANAMVNSGNIVGIGWGGALAVANGNPHSVAPQSKINALANILAACVNTTTSASSQCSTLLTNATNSAGTQPTDEGAAIFNMVHNPTKNLTNLWNLQTSQTVFAPVPAAAPSDLTLPVIYESVAGQASSIAFDANGNAWIGDSASKAVVKLSPQGTLSTSNDGGSFGAISAVAVNPVTEDTWAADSTNNAIYVLDSTGTLLTTITTGSLNKPAGIAFDRSGNGYVVNSGAYVIGEYSSGGTLVQTDSYPTSEGYSTAIAVDYSGDVYTAPGTGNAGVGVVQVGSTTGQYFGNGSAGGTSYIALDATSNVPIVQAQYYTQENNVWTMTNSGVGWRYYLDSSNYAFGGTVTGTYVGNTGGMTAYSPYTTPSSLAMDGACSLWIVNSTPSTVSYDITYSLTGIAVSSSYALTGMSSNGFSTGTATGVGAYTAAPDSAGNVWVANMDGSVTQVLGIATPVATPLVPGKFCTEP